MAEVGDWIVESCSTSDNGDLVLTGAHSLLATFAAAIPAGTVWYSIEDGNNRESGLGTFDGVTTIARTTVHATLIDGVYNESSPGAITLSGNALVSCTFNKTAYEELRDGLITIDFTSVNTPTNLEINTPVHMPSLKEWLYHAWSSTVVDGAALTDNVDGTIDIAELTIMIRATNSGHFPLYVARVDATAGIVLTDNKTNYVYVDYNAGAPVIAVTLDPTIINVADLVPLYVIVREGTKILVVGSLEEGVDPNAKLRKRFFFTEKYKRVDAGSVISESGTRNLFSTAGSFYFGLREISHDAIDTSVTGTFEYYRLISGAWVESDETQFDNLQYNDISTPGAEVLDTLSAGGNYAVHWVYVVLNDDHTDYHVVYSQDEYGTLAAAEAAGSPASLPPSIEGLGQLLGRFIVKKSAASGQMETVWTESFNSAEASTHNGLAGLQGGTVDEYYHLTLAQHTVAVTDLPAHIADSTIHFTEASIVHQNISGAGTNTHAQIDTHIADNTIHFTQASITTVGTLVAGDVSGAIPADSVTLDMMADITTASILGRSTAATGTVEVLSAVTTRSILNVEDGATADQTGAEIKVAYEGEANTNAYTDAEKVIVGNTSGTNTGDEVAASLTVAGIIEIATVTETNTGTDATRSVSPAGLAGFTGTSLITTVGTIGAGTWQGGVIAEAYLQNQSGTNTGDVTLSGTPDYITIAGQVITVNQVDLAADVTGALPVANGGTGVATLGNAGVLVGNGTGVVQVTSAGTAGQVLTSNGAGVDPTFQAAAGGGGSNKTYHTFTSSSDVTITGTTAAAPTAIASGSVTLPTKGIIRIEKFTASVDESSGSGTVTPRFFLMVGSTGYPINFLDSGATPTKARVSAFNFLAVATNGTDTYTDVIDANQGSAQRKPMDIEGIGIPTGAQTLVIGATTEGAGTAVFQGTILTTEFVISIEDLTGGEFP